MRNSRKEFPMHRTKSKLAKARTMQGTSSRESTKLSKGGKRRFHASVAISINPSLSVRRASPTRKLQSRTIGIRVPAGDHDTCWTKPALSLDRVSTIGPGTSMSNTLRHNFQIAVSRTSASVLNLSKLLVPSGLRQRIHVLRWGGVHGTVAKKPAPSNKPAAMASFRCRRNSLANGLSGSRQPGMVGLTPSPMWRRYSRPEAWGTLAKVSTNLTEKDSIQLGSAEQETNPNLHPRDVLQSHRECFKLLNCGLPGVVGVVLWIDSGAYANSESAFVYDTLAPRSAP